jgi:hypothetical protein
MTKAALVAAPPARPTDIGIAILEFQHRPVAFGTLALFTQGIQPENGGGK